jgi:hypothetical protein
VLGSGGEWLGAQLLEGMEGGIECEVGREYAMECTIDGGTGRDRDENAGIPYATYSIDGVDYARCTLPRWFVRDVPAGHFGFAVYSQTESKVVSDLWITNGASVLHGLQRLLASGRYHEAATVARHLVDDRLSPTQGGDRVRPRSSASLFLQPACSKLRMVATTSAIQVVEELEALAVRQRAVVSELLLAIAKLMQPRLSGGCAVVAEDDWMHMDVAEIGLLLRTKLSSALIL